MNNFFSPAPLWQSTGLALVRFAVGIFLIYHGWEIFDETIVNKYLGWDQFKTPSGKFMVYSGKAGEFIAGILFFLGLLTRIACLLTIGVMGYIAFFVGKGIIWYDDQHPFLFVLLGFVFFFTGPGNFSLDKLIFKKS
ncbi:MAG TPA: DoxX family protein [Chitinophagaceae bacterium]